MHHFVWDKPKPMHNTNTRTQLASEFQTFRALDAEFAASARSSDAGHSPRLEPIIKVRAMMWTVYGALLAIVVQGLALQGPEQIHMAYGRAPSKMIFMWSTDQESTSIVYYVLSSAKNDSSQVKVQKGECWRFTAGNAEGLQYMHRVNVTVRCRSCQSSKDRANVNTYPLKILLTPYEDYLVPGLYYLAFSRQIRMRVLSDPLSPLLQLIQ